MGQLSEEPLRTGTEDQIDEMKLCLVSHQITDNWSARLWPRLVTRTLQQTAITQSTSQREGKEAEEMEPTTLLCISFSFSHFCNSRDSRLILQTFFSELKIWFDLSLVFMMYQYTF